MKTWYNIPIGGVCVEHWHAEQAEQQEEYALETAHLARILAVVGARLDALRHSVRGREADMTAARQELLDYGASAVTDLYAMQGFHDLVELSEFAQSLAGEIDAYEAEADSIAQLERMRRSPYFARIDLRFAGEDEDEALYLGRAPLMGEGWGELLVYDWRSPVASVFYRYGAGRFSYDAPAGRVEGLLRRKRQYEIQQGKLLYYFDADMQIVDAFLRRMLAQNASDKMKTIVETIQRDQDEVIRDVTHGLLMVQGAAGSGKTSIALHRVAYLMYQGLASRLSAGDMLILSPNALFERYIDRVLPDLGEQSVQTWTLEAICGTLLPHAHIQPRHAYWEETLCQAQPGQRALMRHSLAFKTSAAFAAILHRFLRELPRRGLPFADVDYAGTRLAPRALLRARVLAEPDDMPLGTRLRRLEHALFSRVHALRAARLAALERRMDALGKTPEDARAYARMYSIHETGALLRHVRAFTRPDAAALYRRLLADPAAVRRLGKGLPLPEDLEAILAFSCARFDAAAPSFDDAGALAYLCAQLAAPQPLRTVRQVVVDEAQDYGALHFSLLDLVFPLARFTVLGDIQQTIGVPHGMALYDQIAAALHRDSAALMTLRRSFRSTEEILAFSARLLDADARPESFARSGEAICVQGAPDANALAALLAREAQACLAQGWETVALLCKTARDARVWHARLTGIPGLQLVCDDRPADLRGVLLLPVYLAKGLEFDAVLVCDADDLHYHNAEDRHILYVACTRALHRLGLYYTGQRSPLIREEGGA